MHIFRDLCFTIFTSVVSFCSVFCIVLFKKIIVAEIRSWLPSLANVRDIKTPLQATSHWTQWLQTHIRHRLCKIKLSYYIVLLRNSRQCLKLPVLFITLSRALERNGRQRFLLKTRVCLFAESKWNWQPCSSASRACINQSIKHTHISVLELCLHNPAYSVHCFIYYGSLRYGDLSDSISLRNLITWLLQWNHTYFQFSDWYSPVIIHNLGVFVLVLTNTKRINQRQHVVKAGNDSNKNNESKVVCEGEEPWICNKGPN